MKRLIMAAVLILAGAASAAAQVSVGGSIEGTVTDQQGGVLPGVSVTAQGVDATQVFTTEADGRYRFLRLAPGPYKVTAALQGFSTLVREDVIVVVGGTVSLPMQLKVATVAETVTVTGESPIVDPKATGTSTNFTSAELNSIPTSRDPWALLRTVPGVMVDRVNIAGNETGQQSNFQSKGTRPADAVWTMDGVAITDMAAIGASPTYFNYSNFDEIQVSTAGQDVRQPTGGVGLNFIVKRGTNQWRGGGRGFFTGEKVEAVNVPEELTLRTPAITGASADHNNRIDDYSFEVGGPVLKDKAWFFGSWAKQDVRLNRSAGALIDRTLLKHNTAKGNWQATKNDMFSVLWFLGAKEKFGRLPGDGGILFDATTATWDQGGLYTEGGLRPQGLIKFEDNHVFGSSFYLSGRYAYYNTGFVLDPKGGMDVSAGRSLVTASSYGSTRKSINVRPQVTVSLDANTFRTMGGASHDFKFGWGYRRTESTVGTIYPGNMILALQNSLTDSRARLYREGIGTDQTSYTDVYLGDTIAKGRVTFDLGIRWDRQWGASLAANNAGNPTFTTLVPGIQFGGYSAPFTWKDISPRLGVTYALDASHKTILRANYSRYAGQLQTGYVGYSNPSANAGWVEYPWNDINGDHLATPNEVNTATVLSFGGGFNPSAPTAVTSADKIDPNLKAPMTQSVVFGIDRELKANLALQVNYSFTKTTDWIQEPWNGVGPGDYVLGALVTGTIPSTIGGVGGGIGSPTSGSYSIQTYNPDSAKVAAGGNGRFLTNYPGYSSKYHGLEVTLIKRMSNRWMARIGGAVMNPTEDYDVKVNYLGNPTPRDVEPLISGGPFVVRSSGSGAGDIFIHGKWQLNANAAYEFGRGVQVSGNLFGRQGYPFPVYRSVPLGLDGATRVLVSPGLDTYRLPNLWDLDLRLSKDFRFGRGHAQIMADLFNVMNSNTGLVRNRNVLGTGATGFYALSQNLSPRIFRIGIDVGF